MKEATMSSRKKSVRLIFTSFVVMALFAMASPAAHAQVTVTEEWAARYDGPAHSSDFVTAIATDNAGNVYVTGYSYGRGTYIDYATIAYDPSGKQLWVARYDGPAHSYDYASAIATDDAGNVYVTGRSYGNGTSWDYATVAYDSSGNRLWVARYNGPGNYYDIATAIATDDAGNVYVTGHSYSGTYYDYTTIAYDPSGNQLWLARYDGPAHSSDVPRAMATDNAGNVYVTGYSRGNGTYSDYATVAYDSYGNRLWLARYDGPAHSSDVPYAIATDKAGNVYVTGVSYGNGTYIDYATIAYDPAGNQLWLARYDGPANSNDHGRAIAVDNAGNVYVTGYSLGSGAYADYATVAYDPSGKQLWVARYDGPAHSSDKACAIAADNAGNVYVTGQSYGSGTRADYATIAYDPSGNRLWLARYNGYNGPANFNDEASAIAIDDAGNVYVTGSSSDGVNGYDYATVKYSQKGQNAPPTADAGPDQTVECASPGGTQVALDGSGSTDPDGDALSYSWTWDGGSAEGATPLVTLPYGTTTVTLTVSDGESEDSDEVEITVRDTTPPSTSAILEGELGKNGWYVSDVDVKLTALDSCTGVKEIHYTINGAETVVSGDTADFTLTEDGEYAVTYGAEDKAGNEASASVTLNIDKTAPVADISVTPGILWPPNHKTVDVAVNGGASDPSSGIASVEFTVTDDYGTVEPLVSGFNTTIPLEAWRSGGDRDGRHYAITAVITDNAGNRTTVTTEAVVPHDMRGKK